MHVKLSDGWRAIFNYITDSPQLTLALWSALRTQRLAVILYRKRITPAVIGYRPLKANTLLMRQIKMANVPF